MVHSQSWVSQELQAALTGLSAQQARGVQRIVQAELAGLPLSRLLDCPDQICTSTTYYGSGKRRGWRDKPAFQQALALARRDYRKWMLHSGVDEALAVLAETAPHAARALRQQVVGDERAIEALTAALRDGAAEVRRRAAVQLGATGQPVVVAALREALAGERDPQVQEALIEALGAVAGLRDGERRLAAANVLDRAAVETAAKETRAHEGEIAYVEVTEGELAAIAEALRREAEGSGAE